MLNVERSENKNSPKNKKILWKGDNQDYLRRSSKRYFLFFIIMTPLIIFLFIQSSLIDISKGEFLDSGWILDLVTVFVIIVFFLMSWYQYKHYEEKISRFSISTISFEEKRIDSWNYVPIKDIERIDIKYKAHGGKIKIFYGSKFPVSDSLEFYVKDVYTVEKILTELIPCRFNQLRKGKRYFSVKD